MTKEKLFMILQSALCILIAVLLAAGAIYIFTEGQARQAAGHPSDWIYTREKVASCLLPLLPPIALSFAFTAYGLVKGIRDKDAGKPVRDGELTRNIRALRVRAAGPEKTSPQAKRRQRILWCALMALAVCFVVMGIVNGSMKDVLVKAIKICSECVGLG